MNNSYIFCIKKPPIINIITNNGIDVIPLGQSNTLILKFIL